ncbi:MAG TPA: DUF2252 family protein [Candidatus Binatia bacterium]|nr:DUF2252 family protein [Candidatus Binatia bacterium]
MNIVESTQRYEKWLQQRLRVIEQDLTQKHTKMAQDPFAFLRATFYRWVQLWPELCPDLQDAPQVLGVGDLHIENFGTWLDAEGRLIWGINDFDEAAPVPYTSDLVRLATSALLALHVRTLSLGPKECCAAILKGYRQGLKSGGRPIVLTEQNKRLRTLVLTQLERQKGFWKELKHLHDQAQQTPPEVKFLLARCLPTGAISDRVVHRTAGLGSRGRERFAAVAQWHGATVVREAKALTTSAWLWETNKSARIWYRLAVTRSVRAADPSVVVTPAWVVRRLSPECCRINLDKLDSPTEEYHLLQLMGWETANVHGGSTQQRESILQDLPNRQPQWLLGAAQSMTKQHRAEWREWRRHERVVPR